MPENSIDLLLRGRGTAFCNEINVSGSFRLGEDLGEDLPTGNLRDPAGSRCVRSEMRLGKRNLHVHRYRKCEKFRIETLLPFDRHLRF